MVFDKTKLNQDKGQAVKKHTILIVDDEKEQVNSLVSLLSDKYHVITSGDGQEALDKILGMEQAEKEKLSVVLSDQRMPGMTGIELFERLITIIPDTRRILVTGLDDLNALAAVNKAKIYECILKPFEPPELERAVKRAVESFEQRFELRTKYQRMEKLHLELRQKNKMIYELNRKIEMTSLSDPLTGLRNRRYLEEFIAHDIARVEKDYQDWTEDQSLPDPCGKSIAFLLLDLDGFKPVNDTYGNTIGDKILVQFSRFLTGICHKGDILVRWRSDEFVIISRFTSPDKVQRLAERLRLAVEAYSFNLGEDNTLKFTCSIGFTIYPFIPNAPDAVNWEKITHIATHALYAVKSSGRNGWIGITGTELTDKDSFLQRIRKDTSSLMDQKEIKVKTSLEKTIKWDYKRNLGDKHEEA